METDWRLPLHCLPWNILNSIKRSCLSEPLLTFSSHSWYHTSHMKLISLFPAIKDPQTDTLELSIILQSHPPCKRAPFFFTSSSTLPLVFLIIVIPTVVWWHLIMALICISLIISCWAYLHVPYGNLYAFCGKMSIQVICLFFLLECLFLILVINPL